MPGKGFCLRGDVDGREAVFTLLVGENSVGSAPDNAIVIPNRAVSRRHAVLHLDRDGLEVEDCGAKNGTSVNGQRVSRSPIRPGDVLGLGPVRLVVEPAPEDDCRLALELPPAGGPDAPVVRPESTASDAGASPARWLHLAEALVVASWGGPERALRQLVDGLGASGAALLDMALEEPVVLARVDAGAPRPLLAAASALAADPRRADGLVAGLVDGNPAGAVALNPRTHHALVLVGAFPGWAACEPLLRLALRLLEPGGVAPVTPLDPAPRLCLPEGHVVGRSLAMRAVYRVLGELASSDLPVLLTGETGSARSTLARALHLSSRPRRRAVPSAELRGDPGRAARGRAVRHREGGRDRSNVRGRAALRLADGGVLFLDEIGDMPLSMQAKLLRALEGGEVQPVGSSEPVRVDIRLVASTNRDLPALVERGAFRRDLYYRLAGAVVRVPPLRRRRDDIPDLVAHFLRRAASSRGRSVRGITVAAPRRPGRRRRGPATSASFSTRSRGSSYAACQASRSPST